MSISASLSNALSGLTAQIKASEIVSANVSNALTEGYGRRSIQLGTQWLSGVGAGVQVSGVLREVDHYVIGQRQLADADVAFGETKTQFFERLQIVLGAPDDPQSLSGQIASFETALIDAASRPDSDTRLSAVLSQAGNIADHLSKASDELQQLRMSADRSIATQVEALNAGLNRIHELNVGIRAQAGTGGDINSLLDQRQQVIDSLSDIVPLRTANRANGQIALYTTGGAILLDGRPPDISFTSVGTITPDMTMASGALYGITINGLPAPATGTGVLAGGSLGAAFDVRDIQAVSAHTELDALARDLIERFADPTVDPSLNPGEPGLFTDGGASFLPVNEIGLATRISINAIVDPAQGGALWHLRDGIGATSPGDVGDATLLQALHDALKAPRSPASGSFAGSLRSASALSADFLSGIHADYRGAETDRAYAQAHRDTLNAVELRDGVDTDYEMQNLLLIEQAYAANARVMTTANELIDILMGL